MVHRQKILLVIVTAASLAALTSVVTILDTGPEYTLINDDDFVLGNSASWSEVTFDGQAETIVITLDYQAEELFEVWLVPTDEPDDMGPFFLGPPPWIRHAVVGDGEVEWTIERSEFEEAGLVLIEENMFWGNEGLISSSETIQFRSEMTVESQLSPFQRLPFWLALFGWIVVTILSIVYARSPKEKVLDIIELDREGRPLKGPYGRDE